MGVNGVTLALPQQKCFVSEPALAISQMSKAQKSETPQQGNQWRGRCKMKRPPPHFPLHLPGSQFSPDANGLQIEKAESGLQAGGSGIRLLMSADLLRHLHLFPEQLAPWMYRLQHYPPASPGGQVCIHMDISQGGIWPVMC